MEIKTSKNYNVVSDVDIISTKVMKLFSAAFEGGENVAEAGEFSFSLSCFFFHLCFPKTMQWVISPLSTVKFGAKQ